MPFDAVFNANDFAPRQGGGAHPVGNKFPFRITNTEVVPTKDNTGGMFAVEFTSDAGSITHRYNLWNSNETARKIAKEQLSALCHAVGIFQIDFRNDGAALRGAVGLMDIGWQKGQEPSQEKPEGGYVELKRVYDKNGNEPGKPAANPAANNFNQQANQQPQQQATNQPAVNSGWNNGPANNPAPTSNNIGGGWNAGGQMPESAPWGAK